MRKIKVLKGNWIEIANSAMNLNSFSNVRKGRLGIDEGGDEPYIIEVTELQKNADGSNNTYVIATYKEDEKKLWEEDYASIIAALNS